MNVLISLDFTILFGLFLTLAVSALVALAEILPRYPDDPFLAAFCRWGWLYIGVNVLVAAFSWLVLLIYFPEFVDSTLIKPFGVDTTSASGIIAFSLVNGLGAMVFLRSKVFSVRSSNGESFSVGPDLFLNSLMDAIDTYIDRHRAYKRSQLVDDKFRDVNPQALAEYTKALIQGSRQNLNTTEVNELGKNIGGIIGSQDGTAGHSQNEAMLIGFLLIDYLGNSFIDKISLPDWVKDSKPVKTGTEPTIPPDDAEDVPIAA